MAKNLSRFFIYSEKIALKQKFKVLNLPIFLLFLLIGFVLGNFFGILTTNCFSDFPIFFSILIIELISFLKYNIAFQIPNQKLFLSLLNFFKNGFLIGIFLEAFKVGS